MAMGRSPWPLAPTAAGISVHRAAPAGLPQTRRRHRSSRGPRDGLSGAKGT